MLYTYILYNSVVKIIGKTGNGNLTIKWKRFIKQFGLLIFLRVKYIDLPYLSSPGNSETVYKTDELQILRFAVDLQSVGSCFWSKKTSIVL